MKPKRRDATRARIVAAAYALFHQRGFARVGVDDIAAAAEVTKRTLYDHFPAKDDIAGAAAAHAAELAEARIAAWLAPLRRDAVAGIDAVFDDLAAWSARRDFSGAGFSRVAQELADLPGHPVRRAAIAHKRRVLALVAEALGDEPRARALLLVLEGVVASLVVERDVATLEAGRELAKRVVGEG